MYKYFKNDDVFDDYPEPEPIEQITPSKKRDFKV
jgi:hypothetical protein